MELSRSRILSLARRTLDRRRTATVVGDPLAGHDPRYDLWGANADAYASRQPEILSAGPAGSGKSLSHLVRIYWACRHNPLARCLILRKTRESLTESVLVTWERDVLGAAHPILSRRPILRRVRQSYDFPNGSVVVVGGMDKPDKVLSSDYDIIYVPEATDIELSDWETLGGRLRTGSVRVDGVPFQQLLADCNPTTPHHWLYRRQASGLLKMYTSTHKDNPRYWNREANDWTPAGRTYLARLERMTGARRSRFLLGKWEAAEGVVYDFDPKIHLLPADWMPDPKWPRVWGIDWGKTSPTVLGYWAVDPEGRMYAYREVYQTRLRPDQLGKWATEEIGAGREPRPRAIVCDHDEERKKHFEKASGLYLQLADKKDRDKGIEAMQARFDLADDGKPRIFFKPDSRETLREKGPDHSLVDAGKPTSGLEELVGYVWDTEYKEDTPIDYNDHFLDQARYVERYVSDNMQPGCGESYTGYDGEPELPDYFGKRMGPDVFR
jgi:Phage terminase large subunit